MDFQSFVDQITIPCAVVSVERTPDGHCGAVRYHRANRAFLKLYNRPFQNDVLYNGSRPRDLRFEEFCFRAAFLGQRIHDYTEAAGGGGWGDLVLSPLVREGDGLGYCQFTMELTRAADPKRLASVSQRSSAGVIRTCLTLRDEGSFLGSVKRVLQDILDETGAAAGRIVRTDGDPQTLTELCACIRPGAPLAAETEGGAPYEIFHAARELDGVTRTVIVTNEQELAFLAGNNPVLAERMRRLGVTSMLLTPLHRDREILGFLYLVNFRTRDVVEIKELVELDCIFLGLELSNHALLARLEEMSLRDELTGLGNRNSMLRRIHAPAPGPFGVVNLDLNGLKLVNDREGHEAGDRLLRRAAEALTAVFDRGDVFRTGGDEFIIFNEAVSEADFLEKAARLRQGDGGVRFSLGVFWSDGSVSAAEALRTADERMYADKQAFYLRHPELRRS